jgi:predicted molibdopterin-dependent oxidoreductase YjgC
MLDAAAAGTLRGLFVMGANPAAVYPDAAKVETALGNLELLVVQDLFLTETARHAHVVLPSLSVMEKNGTLTNVEGRVQRIMRAMDPVGAGRNDWAILNAIAAKLGQSMGYGTVDTIVADIRKALHEAPLSRGSREWTLTGIEYEPAPSSKLQAPGDENVEPGAGSLELTLRLITGRLMFDRSTVQVQSTVLPTLAPDPFVELNPADAKRLSLEAGSMVTVRSPHGSLDLRLRVSDDTPAGAAFIPRGYNQAPVNRLLSDRDESVRVSISRA